MGLLKDVYCDECGKKTNLLTRVKLRDGKYLCSSCAGAIPNYAFKSLLEEYTFDMYHDFLEHIQHSNQHLRRIFTETDHYYSIHVDAKNSLFYIGRRVDERTVFYHFSDILDFELAFDPKEYKNGLLGDRVTGRVLMKLEMLDPDFRYEVVLDESAVTEAKKTLFGTKLEYDNPPGMDRFHLLFLMLWKEDTLEADYAETFEAYTGRPLQVQKTAPGPQLQQAMALFMIDDLDRVTPEELKRQRNRLIKTFHPDAASPETTKYAQRINAAYEILKQAIS